MAKQGRNERCDCGSGKKYKHCHGKLTSANDESRPSEADIAAIQRQAESINAAEYRRRLMHGLGRPIVSFERNGFRFVQVGNEIRYSQSWNTFADFLMAYVITTLTEKWARAELAKPTLEMHPIMRWYKHVRGSIASAKTMAVNSRLRESQMDGTARAFLGLAYDLFVCAHNVKTQELLIKRLRKKPTFGGALYEANVIGWFIRAGFTVEFEDESNPNSTHCEFVATHGETKKKYSVEAKSIGDDSSYAGNSEKTPRIRHKLIEALRKSAEHTRVVFIDLNRAEHVVAGGPPPAWEPKLHEEVAQCENDLIIDDAPAPPAYVFMTNRGYLHRMKETTWAEFAVVDGFKIRDFPIGKGCTSIIEMHHARERNLEMYWLTQAMVNGTPVPSTFDGRPPEEAYSTVAIQRLRMGERISIDVDEVTVSGVMVDGFVDDRENSAFITLQTDKAYENVIVSLSEVEMAIYRSSPDTFFDVVKPVNKPLTKPLEWFDFFAKTYIGAEKETLLEWMKAHPDIEELRAKPQREVAEQYCARMATSVWQRGQQSSG